MLGTRDYLEKNGFSDVVIGLSGGIDSTLVAVIAVDAIGADRVHGVSMPSRYSSDHSRSDAEKLASNLGIDYRTIAIEPAHAALLDMLAPSFAERAPDLTEENLQSRIRGMTLMALSNKFGWIVLTTGNKSEMAVGLRDDLRRHGRRLWSPQGRVQVPRVPAVPTAQRAGRSASSSPRRSSPSHRRPNCAPTSVTTRAFPRTTCSTRSSSSTSRTTGPSPT